MKTMLPLLLLSLLFMLPGCGGGPGSLSAATCTFSGPPNVRYVVTYPNGGTPSTGTVPASGTFSVLAQGALCTQLTVVFGSNSNFALAASPSSVYLPSPPSSGTITGQGFDATYGMPTVEYFDGNGFLIGLVYATSVSTDGTSLQANLPNLSNVYSGTYQVKVTNKRSDGYYLHIVGSATITAWGRDRTDSDSDGWYDDEDCAPDDPYIHSDCASETCGGYGTVPRTLCEPL
jgi:hypothetical protein